MIFSFTFTTCKKADKISLPVAITYTPLFIESTYVTIGCMVESDGGSPIVGCGIYMGLSQNPETTGTQLQIATDTGSFLGQVSGLLPNTQYFIKAYAKNVRGESLGAQVNFTTPGTITDYENNIYETVRIGTQLWMAQNLGTTHYLNGDIIVTTNPATLDISNVTSPEFQWSYGGVDANVIIYGKLYTWYTITDSRKVCPTGWHIPTDSDWTSLESTLGGYIIAGSELKEAGNSHWASPYNLDATNESCFKALPGGYRNVTGGFLSLGSYGNWWSSTDGDATNGWIQSLFVQTGQISKTVFLKVNGASVRCIKD